MQLDFATTTMPTILLWGLGLLIFLIGGLLGYFNMNMDANKKMGESERKIAVARAEADRRIAEAQQKLEEARALKAQVPQGVNEPSLMRLKSDDGFRVQVEVDGQMLTAPLTPEKRKRVIELLNHVRPWLEGATAAPQTVSKPVAAAPTPLEPALVAQITPTVKPVPAVLSLNPQKPKVDPEMEFKLLSMVRQIDTVLQKRLMGTALEASGIRLQETPQGGIEVYIGTQVFESIDDVPDANVKAAIRAAITEWETKYVPGT